jgi:hypothetical protein
MISRQGRNKAAELVRGYRDCVITNDDLTDDWPTSKQDEEDRALRAIELTLWGAYSDTHNHKAEGRHALEAEGRELFDRCAQFLDTDLPYEWPTHRLYPGEGGIPPILVVLSWGLLARLNRYWERRYRLQESAGDSRIWPFIRRSDYDLARGAAASDATPAASPAPSWISSQRLRSMPPP